MDGVPELYRAKAYLDLGQYDKAIESTSAMNQEKRGRGTFLSTDTYLPYLETRGIALALAGRRNEASEVIRKLEAVSTFAGSAIVGPAKYAALARIHVANGDYDLGLKAIRHPDAKTFFSVSNSVSIVTRRQ